MSLEIIVTGDGSHSLFNRELNETYHSTHGAVQESKHVFLAMGFDYVNQQHNQRPVRILEIGFGTGLNAWLTCLHTQQTLTPTRYTSLETFPLPADIWKQLTYATTPDALAVFHALHQAPWEDEVTITPHFILIKRQIAVQEITLPDDSCDLIYFDAFAPNKQPEMWELPVFQKLYRALAAGGVLVTYCAKGQVKRDLRATGFVVEALQGPPGKREMIRAIKR